jgi:hypothetical protein
MSCSAVVQSEKRLIDSGPSDTHCFQQPSGTIPVEAKDTVMPLDAQAPSRVVTATLNYLVPGAEKPARYVGDPPPGRLAWNGASDPRQVAIADGRGHEADFTLDRNGFALRQVPSAVRDFFDPAEVADVYYKETEALVRAEMGASRVIGFDHTLRGPDAPREPVMRVHNDYTERSAAQRVRDLLPDEAEALLARRFVFANVWRPVRVLAVDTPLALCDATSFTDDDLVPTDLIYADRVGETASVRFNPSHRWVFFSGMRPDEVVLIKCHDSATDGRARISFHTAFRDPTAPVDAPARQSIELRTIAFFD